ncbi:MAG TPA: S8 family serine peptidase [Gemmatimonadaceae bacterium]|nr:S8 family serine peptidase [Gemmatimonadaceae bacterium]
MKLESLASGALAAVMLLSGCADEPVAPVNALDVASLSPNVMAASGLPTEEVPRHLVVFKSNRIPADFAQRVQRMGGKVELTIKSIGAVSISGLADASLATLDKDSRVASVEPVAVLAMAEPALRMAPARADAMPTSQDNPAGSFFFSRQWDMRAIGADVAWASGATGSSNVRVAILDTGIGYTHLDLAGRVDLAHSVSFVAIDDLYVGAFFPGAHPIADIGYHGTHVAATVASNGLVAAGVTSRTTLMGVKVCSVVTGGCAGDAIFAGIEYAVDNGADIINMSLGGAFLKSANPGFVSLINRLFDYAHQHDVTVVVSAGNEAADLDHNVYPDVNDVMTHFPSLYKTYCSTPHNICVSATGPTASAGVNGPWTDVDAFASYSNFGRSAVSLAAPGGNDGGLVWAACSTFSLIQGLTVCQQNGFAVSLGGTSMASPHVAGVAALVMAQRGKLKPSQVASILRTSADDLGQRGTDPFYGSGRVNAARAVGAIK